jgi:hypothetical protein
LLRAPASWPEPLVAAVAMLLLAAIDLAAAYVTKEAVLRRSPTWGGVGVALFLLLFYVFASSLQYADLALVTLGWVVVLQVGVVLLDRFRYGAALGTDKWVAVAVILVAQAYLLLAPTRAPQAAGAQDRPSSASGQTVVDLDAATHPVITR